MKVLSLDISGNFEEGKGTTGYTVGSANGTIFEIGDVCAKDYSNRMEYFDKVISLIKQKDIQLVVCENYRLYGNKSKEQTHSLLETPRIIGALEYYCYKNKIPIKFQMAVDVKRRFNEELLIKKKIFEKRNNFIYFNDIKTNDHMRDSFKHYLYFLKYYLKKKYKNL